jgi:hypothetical protein
MEMAKSHPERKVDGPSNSTRVQSDGFKERKPMLKIRTLTRLIASYRANGHVSCFREIVAAVFAVRGHGGRAIVATFVWHSSGYMLRSFT